MAAPATIELFFRSPTLPHSRLGALQVGRLGNDSHVSQSISALSCLTLMTLKALPAVGTHWPRVVLRIACLPSINFTSRLIHNVM